MQICSDKFHAKVGGESESFIKDDGEELEADTVSEDEEDEESENLDLRKCKGHWKNGGKCTNNAFTDGCFRRHLKQMK